jgi:hypothetical protein
VITAESDGVQCLRREVGNGRPRSRRLVSGLSRGDRWHSTEDRVDELLRVGLGRRTTGAHLRKVVAVRGLWRRPRAARRPSSDELATSFWIAIEVRRIVETPLAKDYNE